MIENAVVNAFAFGLCVSAFLRFCLSAYYTPPSLLHSLFL